MLAVLGGRCAVAGNDREFFKLKGTDRKAAFQKREGKALPYFAS